MNFTSFRSRNNLQNARDAAEVLSEYKSNFGDFSIDKIHYWPLAQMVMKRYDLTVDEFNDWLDKYCRT